MDSTSFQIFDLTSKISRFCAMCNAWWLLLFYDLPTCQSGQEWQKVAEENCDNVTVIRMKRNIGNLTKKTLTYSDRLSDRYDSVDDRESFAGVQWSKRFGELC